MIVTVEKSNFQGLFCRGWSLLIDHIMIIRTVRVLSFMVILLGVTHAVDPEPTVNSPPQARQSQTKRTSSSQGEQAAKLEQRVATLETKLNQLMGIVIPDVENALNAMVSSKAQSDSATIMVINRINTLQNKIKILEDKAAYSDSSNLQILQQLMMIENKIVTLTKSFNELYGMRIGKAESRAGGMSSDEFKRNYVKALSQYQNGDFHKAIEGFSALAGADPNHKLADNSQYWLGEAFYSLKNYKRAVLEFQKVFQFEENDKWDDAQIKLGICHQKMGNLDKARDEFQKLLDRYPDSEYTQRAQQYLRQL